MSNRTAASAATLAAERPQSAPGPETALLPDAVGRERVRAFVAVALAVFVMEAGVLLAGPEHVGLAILALAAAIALVVSGLSSPVTAVVLLLMALFLRLAVPATGLPADPFILAFAGVVGSATIALARGREQAPRLGAVEFAMLLYLVWNIGSAIVPHELAPYEPVGAEEIPVDRFILAGTVIPFVLYVVGRSMFRKASSVRVLLWAVLGLATYSAAVSILQFTGPTAIIWPRYIVDSPNWEGRANGVFNGPVDNGLLMIMGFVIAVYLMHRSPALAQRILLGFVTVACLAGVYLTHTRAVWLALGLVLVLGVVLGSGLRTGFALALTAACCGIAATWSTFSGSDRDAGGVTSVNELDDRLNGIATSLWAIAERPFAGWGIARFTEVNTYYHQQWAQDVPWIRGYSISSHHNELGIAVELGLIGLALWLVVLGLVGYRLISAVRTLPDAGFCGRSLAVVAMLFMVVWLVIGQTIDLRYLDFASAAVWLIAGIAVGRAEWNEAETRPASVTRFNTTLRAPVGTS